MNILTLKSRFFSVRKSRKPRENDSAKDEKGAEKAFLLKARQMRKVPPVLWKNEDLSDLQGHAHQALEQARKEAQKPAPGLGLGLSHTHVESTRDRLRQHFLALDFPQEVLDTLEFTRLERLLRAREAQKRADFSRQTLLSSAQRHDLQLRYVEEAVAKAEKLAHQEFVAQQADLAESDRESSPETPPLSKHLRQLKRQKRFLGIDTANQVSNQVLATMRALRQQVAPQWTPEKQPWLLRHGDEHIYRTTLAVIPEALFAQTQNYEAINRLRHMPTGN